MNKKYEQIIRANKLGCRVRYQERTKTWHAVVTEGLFADWDGAGKSADAAIAKAVDYYLKDTPDAKR